MTRAQQAIRKVEKWETSDRQLHSWEDSALRHQENIHRAEDMTALLQAGGSVGDCLRSEGQTCPDPILNEVTAESLLVISHYQCRDTPGYKVVEFRSNGRVFCFGDAGSWSGPYGGEEELSCLIRYAKDPRSILNPQSDTMTDQEKRIKIAAACGYNLHVIVKRGMYYRPNGHGYTHSLDEAWKLPEDEAKKHEMYVGRTDVAPDEIVSTMPAPIPDYLSDLNAMHEALKACLTTNKLANAYEQHLTEIRIREYSGEPLGLGCAFATAAQQAEAFGLTLNLWTP